MSPPDQLPRSVVAFLRAHVDQIAKLRFVLFLHGAPSGSTSVDIAAGALDLPRQQVCEMAAELAAAQLIHVADNQLELAPSSIDDRLAIADLASWYARDRNLVLDVLRELGR